MTDDELIARLQKWAAIEGGTGDLFALAADRIAQLTPGPTVGAPTGTDDEIDVQIRGVDVHIRPTVIARQVLDGLVEDHDLQWWRGRAITLGHEVLVLNGIDPESEETEQDRAGVAARPTENVSPFRANPEPPDNLYEIYTLARDAAPSMGYLHGLQAVWRHGCDAGMVAP